MSSDDTIDELEEHFEETEEASSQFSEYQQEVREKKQRLVQKIQELEHDHEISSTKAEAALKQVSNANYGKARQILKEAIEKQGLEFSAEEKNLFAKKFTEEYRRLDSGVDQIKTELLTLREQIDREDLIDYLYGKYSKFTKTELREVFDAIEDVTSSGFSTKDQARVLSTFNHNLTIQTTTEILKQIEKEV